jgi:hypothetical protein
MVSGNPFLDEDDVDENDLDLSLGLQDLHASTNQDSTDAVAGGFGFGLDDDTDDEDDLALPSLDDYENELLVSEQSAENFSSITEPENDIDDTASVGNHAQDNLLMSTDVDSDTEDEILFDGEDDSADFDAGLRPNNDNRESEESSNNADESHGSIVYGDFDDDDEFIFDDDEDEDDFSDNSFLSSSSDGVLDADGVRDIVRRLEMAGAEPDDEDTNDDEIDEDDDNFAWVDDDDSSSEAGSPFMQRGLLSGGPESSEDDEEEGGWSFEDVPPEEEGFSDSRLFEDDDETLFDDDEDEDELYDFDSPDSTDFLTNDFSGRDQIDHGNVSDSDQDNNFKDDEQPVDSGTPDGSVSDPDGSSSNKTSDDNKDNESSFTELLKAFAAGIGERVSAVVTDVKNDLRGHDGEIPDSTSDDEDEEGSDSEEKGSGDSKSKKPVTKKSKSNSNPLKSLLSTIGGFYNKLVGIFFKIITSVLGVLAGIPVIGRPFKIALAATRILEIIAKGAPALLLVAGLVTMSWMSVPGSTTTELPDEGKVEFSSFSYSNGGTALGVMKNTGEVSVEGQAQFTVYSLQPGWNPNSWFIYQAEKTCESNVVTVDIESQTEVSASCGQASGWLPRVSGTIK